MVAGSERETRDTDLIFVNSKRDEWLNDVKVLPSLTRNYMQRTTKQTVKKGLVLCQTSKWYGTGEANHSVMI